MYIRELMDEADLDQALKSGLVSKRKHPKFPIYILNYTAAAQYNWVWTPVTLNCRGLVVDEDNNIVARSFPKFFSYEQLDGKLPPGTFVVEEKLDGSMLMLFRYHDTLVRYCHLCNLFKPSQWYELYNTPYGVWEEKIV